LRDEIDVEGVEGGFESHAGAAYSGFAAGVSGADDYNVEIFGEGHEFLFYRDDAPQGLKPSNKPLLSGTSEDVP